MIYFIQDTVTKAVKIGHGVNPEKRLEQCQVGNANALTMIGVLEGGRPEERLLHQRFASHRMRGEWFRGDDKLLSAIRAMPIKEISFMEWVFRQSGRGDLIGDLSEDLSIDQRARRWAWDGKLKSLLSRITRRNGCREAREAAEEAWNEYQASSA